LKNSRQRATEPTEVAFSFDKKSTSLSKAGRMKIAIGLHGKKDAEIRAKEWDKKRTEISAFGNQGAHHTNPRIRKEGNPLRVMEMEKGGT